MKKLDTYKLILYPLVLAILVIYSVLQVGLDMSKILTEKFWLELFFKYLLQVAWIYFGIPDGKTNGESKDNYKESKSLLNKAITLIKDKGLLTTFGLFVKADYQEQRNQYVKDILFANGIPEKLYELSLHEIKVKLNDYSLTKWHYRLIKKLKYGEFEFPYVDPQVYLSAYDIKTRIQMALYSEKRTILRELFPKMVLTFVTLAISSSAVISDDISVGQAVYDSIFNVGLSIMSYGFAFKLGLDIMSDYSKIYDIRRNYISKFIEKHDNGSLVKELRIYEVAEVVKSWYNFNRKENLWKNKNKKYLAVVYQLLRLS